MLDKLKTKFSSGLTKSIKSNEPVPTPDLSRVIKPAAASAPIAPVAKTKAPDVSAANPSEPHTTLEMEARAEAAVENLSDKFEAWMKGDLDKLMAAWIVASGPDATPADYQALFMAAHDIHGAAVSYGYPAVSRLCGSLGTLLGNTRPGENSALINLHVEACRAAFKAENPADGGEEIANAVCSALEDKVAYYTSG